MTSAVAITANGLERVNDMYSVGAFVTLPPSYTHERGAVLRVTQPFTLNEYGSLVGQFDCWWPDGRSTHYPYYLVFHPTHLHVVIDSCDDEAWAMRVLAGFSKDTPGSVRCSECSKWLSPKDLAKATEWKANRHKQFKPSHDYYTNR